MFKDCCNPKNFYSNENYEQVCVKGSNGLRNGETLSSKAGGNNLQHMHMHQHMHLNH
jgi:hypothetical protein